MKQTVWISAAVVAIVLGAGAAFLLLNEKGKSAVPVLASAGSSAAAPKLGLNVWKCLGGTAIDPVIRSEIESAALAFADLFARSPAEARSQMSELGKTEAPAAAMEKFSAAYRTEETSSSRSITETYLVTSQGSAGSSGRVPCGEDETAGALRFVMRGSTASNAVVLMDEDLPLGGRRTTTVWLENENGHWRTRGMHFGTTRIASFDGREFWQLARAQRVLGHELNASLLYSVAGQIRGGGAIYQPAYIQGYQADAAKFKPPSFLQGGAPYEWTFGGRTFDLDDIRISSLAPGYLKLTLQHSTPLQSREQGAAINRKLIEGFDKAYPEWKDSFKAIAVRATKPWNDEVVEAEFDRDGHYTAR